MSGWDMEQKHSAQGQARFARPQNRQGMYREFDATELYCPKCRKAVPVRKRLLLVLPEGDKYEYLCAYCSQSVGTKIDREIKPMSVII
ncbi:MAG: cytoplasmic protein [Pseudomonadota bacterium]